MYWKLLKENTKVKIQAGLLLLFLFTLPVFNVYADVKQATDTTTNMALDILYGPVAKIAAAVCAVMLFIRLIQRDIASVAYLLAAAIILFKLKDIIGMITGQ